MRIIYLKVVGVSGNGKTSLIKLLLGLNIECIRITTSYRA